MTSITVRGVDDQLLEKLRLRAKYNHRSVQGEMMWMIEFHCSGVALPLPEPAQRGRGRGKQR